LDLRPRLAAGKLDQRRRDVLANHEIAHASSGLYLRRKSHGERRTNAFFVREAPLGPQPMLAEEVTVVAQKNDERFVELSLSLQCFQDRAHAFVDGSH